MKKLGKAQSMVKVKTPMPIHANSTFDGRVRMRSNTSAASQLVNLNDESNRLPSSEERPSSTKNNNSALKLLGPRPVKLNFGSDKGSLNKIIMQNTDIEEEIGT